MKRKYRDKLKELAKNYGAVYNTLCLHDSLKFVLYFMKINILHVLFEVLITVSYMTLVVFYSPTYGVGQAIPMSTFFSQILFTCAIIYSIITLFYLLVILLFSMYHARTGDLYGINTYTKVIKQGIYGGLFAYILMGVLTAIWPSFFTGVNGLSFGVLQSVKIAISIALFGFAWFVLSMLRLKRVNWNDAIKVEIAELQCLYCQKDDGTTRPINIKTLSYTFASAIIQALIICAIMIIFVKALMSIPLAEQEEFNFFNLTLAVFFAIISTYVTILLKNEFIGSFPGFSICMCAKSSKSKNNKS